MDQKKVGRFLKELRKEKGITQEQLAEKLNVSGRSVSRWETGSNMPDISLLVEIADYYDVDVRELIDGERKSEMMNEETREVADKMATYAGREKNNLLRFVQICGIAGIVLSILALVLQTITYEPDLRRSGAIFATFAVFVMTCVITLYVTGILQKISEHKKLVKTIKIVTIVILGIGVHYFIITVLVIGMAMASVLGAKIKVTNDIADYNTYIHNGKGAASEYQMGSYEEFGVFPEHIPEGANVEEFQLMYYNPWDPQYITYMTLDYEEGYDEEIARLQSIGVDEYIGFYTVTGEPDGYDLVAIDSDQYYGFVYAMIPEGSDLQNGDAGEGTGNTRITYVGIMFCNYALDVDVHQYLPDKYILPGFDATDNNPYRKKLMGE